MLQTWRPRKTGLRSAATRYLELKVPAEIYQNPYRSPNLSWPQNNGIVLGPPGSLQKQISVLSQWECPLLTTLRADPGVHD